jgi:hypothetical protein
MTETTTITAAAADTCNLGDLTVNRMGFGTHAADAARAADGRGRRAE